MHSSEIHFRSHFWPFQIDTQLYFVWKLLTKWLPSAILDVRNSLSITFLAILDQYATFFVWKCFTKWLPSAIFGYLKFISFAFLANLDKYGFFIFFEKLLQNGRRRPFWKSEIHFLSHFWPFQIDTQLYFFFKYSTKWLPSAIFGYLKFISF